MKVWEQFQQVKLNPLFPRTSADELINGEEKIKSELSLISPKLLPHILNIGVGIEIEVENTSAIFPTGWARHRDASLRGDNALEFITHYGFRLGHTFNLLNDLSTHIEYVRKINKKPSLFSFSERTSTHVHLDCRTLTLDQIRSFVQLYILFEDSLFEYSGASRKENIFCIPLRKSYLLGMYNLIETYIRRWEKYAAFNLTSLRDKGTVEFRHMEGNCDPYRIFRWCLLLSCLHYWATRWTRSEVRNILNSLTVESQYDLLAHNIFGSLVSLLVLFPKEMEQAVVDAKLLNEDH